ncbi:MAG: phosphatidylserine decarboxylase [Caldilineaceae bacterium]
MKPLTENLQFLQEFIRHISEVGAVLPTSTYAADALAAEIARHQGPKRVLEVGAGTGAITAQLVRYIQPGDELVLCEINETFMTLLQARFTREALFQRVASQTQFSVASILDLSDDVGFDFIISAIPFNNCPPDFVDAVLAHYRRLLKPGGVLSYIEYMGGRTVKVLSGADPQLRARQQVYQHFLGQYEFRRELVFRNVPPAWIHYLRYAPAAPQQALTLAPRTNNHRIAVSPLTMDSAVLPFWALSGAAALWLRKVAPQSRLWWAAAALLPLLAAFFRDPQHPSLRDPSTAYAASDGVVLAVEEITDPRFGETRWLRIAVFLSLLDVHVNYAPIAGRVIDRLEEVGGFAAANVAAAEHNQALYTVIEGVQGQCIVAQRVGLIARRIINRCKPGSLVSQGEKIGLIRFGSRTDVYLPAAQTQALVQAGDKVIGGVTPLARWVGR